MSFFDHILDTLRANGLDATDLDTVKSYAEHDQARFQQMTSAERQERSLGYEKFERRITDCTEPPR